MKGNASKAWAIPWQKPNLALAVGRRKGREAKRERAAPGKFHVCYILKARTLLIRREESLPHRRFHSSRW